MALIRLDSNNPEQIFPAADNALAEPNGLLAYGGCLSVDRLLLAYRQGIFPWYNPGEPILWWSPDPRLVMFPDKLKISGSLRKTLRKQLFRIKFDSAFHAVMKACAAPRPGSAGTWINRDMMRAYQALHDQGDAHSFEAWLGDELVGGLYGVAIGRVFFGESMFHTQTDASKVVFVHLINQLSLWGYQLIDCQVCNPHLLSLGAEEIPRDEFQSLLAGHCGEKPHPSAWSGVYD